MNCSFIIITNSKKYKECCLQILSIIAQKIPKYEILLCGDISASLEQFISTKNIPYTSIHRPKEAKNGKLGSMRNAACSQAKYDNLIISDDDMLFTFKWYESLLSRTSDFDILTTQVRLPDGTRFWDHCCYMSPAKGHIVLNPDETDDYLYMSGGQSWIMKKYVYDKVKWDENIEIYSMSNLNEYKQGKHNEDTDYSLRCRKYFRISYDHNVVVYHNDASYTSIGRVVRRRYNNAPNTWLRTILLPPEIMINFAMELLSLKLEADALDILRTIYIRYPSKFDDVRKYLTDIENYYGGPLIDSNYSIVNKEYDELLKVYRV
jgi:hypothetical protein